MVSSCSQRQGTTLDLFPGTPPASSSDGLNAEGDFPMGSGICHFVIGGSCSLWML